MSIERKSAAIMFTDIAGYTEAMSENEQKALEMLRKKRSIIKPLINNYNGIYVKEIGDGTLSYFESGFSASACAKDLQRQIQENSLKIRVGIHIGDIVFDEEDVYGDGVNIASRIESLAPIGGVLISKNVYDELINKDGFEGVHLGLQSLKGVGRLVDVYAIKDDYLVVPKPEDYKENEVQIHKDDEVPSIAIIPFKNKGAEEDIFYAYGISSDLISDCSSANNVNVSGLNDIEQLEYESLKYSELAKNLSVRYVSTGTLWKMGAMFQLSIELYDTKNKKVIWSDRWQEKWDNLPKIKDCLSEGLLKALDTKINSDNDKENLNPEAYEFYLKSKHTWNTRRTQEDEKVAKAFLNQALTIDGNMSEARLFSATMIFDSQHKAGLNEALEIIFKLLKESEKNNNYKFIMKCLNNIGFFYNNSGEYANAEVYLNKLINIANEQNDENMLANANSNLAVSIFFGSKNLEDIHKAKKYLQKAIDIATSNDKFKSLATYLQFRAQMHWRLGDYKNAINDFNSSLELFLKYQNTTRIENNHFMMGLLLYEMGDYEKALIYFKDSSEVKKDIKGNTYYLIQIYFIRIYYNLCNYEKALDALEKLSKNIGCDNTFNLASYKNNIELFYYIFLNLCKKASNKNFKNDIIDSYLKIINIDNIDYEVIFHLYNLYDDKSYIEKAYSRLKDEKLKRFEDEFIDNFLSYPIPKAIVEEWEKVK